MKRQALRVLIPMLAGVCLLLASVKTDYDHQADFSHYKTYSWISSKGSNDLWSERIMQDVDQQLAAKGWTKAESGGDASVSAFGRVRNEQTLNTFYDGLGGGWRWGGFGESTTTVENTPVGSLVVDVFDSSSKKLIWRGTATDTLSENPDKNEKKLEHSVEDIFKHFPPSKG
ncbi:MAG TPA: DUF4136 domain-containing protein [Bryobacteraceae bacterium]|jgi:hypothetical protein|nr:DUF4136 domain-containing protein [Bryobacteraceae bacterium]